MIAVGVMVVIMDFNPGNGLMNDDEPIGEHDAAFQMWALHILPMGLFAIGTGLFVIK